MNSVCKLMRMWAIFCWTDGKFCNKIKVSIIIKLFPLKSVFGLESVVKSKQTPNVSSWPVAPNGSNQNWKKINTTGAEREVERATKAHALPQSSFWKLSRSDCQMRKGKKAVSRVQLDSLRNFYRPFFLCYIHNNVSHFLAKFKFNYP